MSIQSSTTHNSQKIGTTLMSKNWWVVKIQYNRQNRILLSNKKKWIPALFLSSSKQRNELSIHATTWMNLEWSERGQSQKTTYYMISFTWNFQSRHLCMDRKYINGCTGLRRDLGMMENWYKISFRDYENFLRFCDNSCTTLNMWKVNEVKRLN